MSKYYMIGNTHFDPVWEWKWDEAMSSIRATFRSALDRMNEYSDFIYSFSSPPVFEWIKKTDSDMFEEIKRRIDEGKWDLAEGWWNQPDCFSASGESYVRQGLYGQRYLMKNFGKLSECAFNTDSFGHPDMLPQILKKSGIKNYCMCRPEERHYSLKSPLFRWQSGDGSSVKAFRMGGSAGEGWSKDMAWVFNDLKDAKEDLLVVYGVTDHGGAPTKVAIEEIIKNNNAEFSTVNGYFEEQTDIQYNISDEFITGDFGVYSNNTSIKQMNRTAEYALMNAEKSCVIADENNVGLLEKCWHDVLFNQFHDILGGASIKSAYTDAENLYGRAIQTANEIMHFNLQRMTAQIKMPGKNPDNVWNLVLWNLNCCEYDGYVEAEVQWAHEFDWYDGGIILEDADGNRTETQIIDEHSAIPRFRTRFIFKSQIPSMGYKCFKVIRNNDTAEKEKRNDLYRIETDNFVYVISKENGCLSEVYDKKKQKTVLKNLFMPNCYRDDGDTWCFNIENYGERLGGFSVEDAEFVESGAIFDKLKVSLKYRNSLLKVYYKFYKGEEYFDIDYIVNWNEEYTVFKMDCELYDDNITVSTPYSKMRRIKSKSDKPVGEWLKTDKYTVLSNGLFAYNFYDNKLGFTVLRSPIYGDFRLKELPQKDHMIMEQGITSGQIRVMLGECAAPLDAMKFNNPPIVICESNHTGKMPPTAEFIRFTANSAVVSAVKHCEDDDGIIIRIVNYGAEENASLNLYGRDYNISIGKREIKTLKYKENALTEVNMLEK